MPPTHHLIYDWNQAGGSEWELRSPILLTDETLRDGLQSPSVLDPPIEKKIHLLHLMEGLGIDSVNLGLPGAGPRAKQDVLRLAEELAAAKLRIRPNCAARTLESDIRPIAEIVQATGVANSLAAFAAGADQAHGSGLGIGERVGNTPLDQLLVNLKLMGAIDRDLSKLQEYAQAISEAVGVPIPPNYPVVGADAFRTATGVHAAAVIKAFRKNDVESANRVYSGVPSHWFGLEQKIEIGPMSGKSNVVYWLEKRGLQPTKARVKKIFARAKLADRLLTDAEILKLCALPAAAGTPGGERRKGQTRRRGDSPHKPRPE